MREGRACFVRPEKRLQGFLPGAGARVGPEPAAMIRGEKRDEKVLTRGGQGLSEPCAANER